MENRVGGERDLAALCFAMSPALQPGVYVYCTFADFVIPGELEPVCVFRELEGLTAIVEKNRVEQLNIPYAFEARLITLTVHSSLEAVGFIAAVASLLAKARIACNVIAAYYHDHLFVPVDRADEAIELLQDLSVTASPPGTAN